MLKYRFKNFPAGCNVNDLVIRETNGEDEATALRLVKAKGGSDGASLLNELMTLSLVEVDGVPAQQPYDTSKWNSKTRSVVMKAFLKINSVEDKAEADFLASVEPLPA